MTLIGDPPILVSAVSTNLSALRQHWQAAGDERERPLERRGSDRKPAVALGGALCRRGGDARTLDWCMPSALLPDGDDLLVASVWSVARVDRSLNASMDDAWDLPLLNAVHWLSRTPTGWLVTSSGLDLIFEIDRCGRVVWTWWAVDHGFSVDPLGRPRRIDREIDHRGIDYGTLANTTHVNAAVAMPDGTVAATLFHQGSLVQIRRDGTHEVLLGGLDHPHAVRLLPDGRLSVVDTGRGLVVLVDPDSSATIAMDMVSTDWLQDASWDPVRRSWLLVDGRRPCVTIVPSLTPDAPQRDSSRVVRFDREWRLYAAIWDPWDGAEREVRP